MDTRIQAEEPTETIVEGHFNGNYGGDRVGINTDTNNYEQTLHKWQQELLSRYGRHNQLDATYKMTEYDLASVSKPMLVIQGLWFKVRWLKVFLKPWLR